MNWRLTRLDTVGSTNDLALEWIREGTARPGDVLVARRQTAGRGRPGRSWHSPEGALLLTAILPFYPERAGWTALVTGLAAAEAVRGLGAPAEVKWPNDVLLSRRKLAGILVESSSLSLVAVGIGLNVLNPTPDDPELSARAIHLADVVPTVTVAEVEAALLASLGARWETLATEPIERLRRSWDALDASRGRRLRWSHLQLDGVAEGVDETGALLIRSGDGGLHRAQVGEVTFVDL